MTLTTRSALAVEFMKALLEGGRMLPMTEVATAGFALADLVSRENLREWDAINTKPGPFRPSL